MSVVAALSGAPAAAQVGEGLIVQTAIPQATDRGRNVAVLEEPRPEYAANGVRFSSFTFYPSVEVGAGGTSNTYYDERHPTASPILYLRPSGRLVSDWSRNFLAVSGSATLRDYLGQSRRNERIWSLAARGRLDVSTPFQVQITDTASQNVESLFSGEVTATAAALSHYTRNYASIQPTYTAGRARAFLLADYTTLRFDRLPLIGGGSRDQSDRDRDTVRLTAQFEYARSPTISAFAQLGVSRTNYLRDTILSSGGPNLDSKAIRILGGVNFDISGRMRGTIGVGYSIRQFDSNVYGTVRGVSVESQVAFFPLQRLTVTLKLDRTLQDASFGVFNTSPYFDTRLSANTDYELLYNLILNVVGEVARQSNIGNSSNDNTVYRVASGGRYLASRRVQLNGTLSYTHRSGNNAGAGAVAEARVEAGVAYQL